SPGRRGFNGPEAPPATKASGRPLRVRVRVTAGPLLSWLRALVALGLIQAWPAGPAARGAESLKTEGRMPLWHHLPRRDAAGQILALPPPVDDQGKPQEARANPYSTAQTCGRCHEYEAIGRGWHFNAALGNVKAGRPGEPWILTDPATRTQIPLSYRG